MTKCKFCGGTYMSVGNGQYQCDCCGNVFDEDDFAPKTSLRKEVRSIDADLGADLFTRVINGVIEIECCGKEHISRGSGYIISQYGYAMTNAHVATDKDGKPYVNISAYICGKTVAAKVVALADNERGHGDGVDLAIIKLNSMPQDAIVLQLADFNDVHTGERVYVLGNSLGDGTCITSGIVSDKKRIRNGKTLLMTDCAVNHGNSGGPIFNIDGKVIGTICSGRLNKDGTAAEGMNYAVPINIVEAFIKKSGIML